MNHFNNALTVRLRSHHKTYLSTDPRDDAHVKLLSNGASRASRWTVEIVAGSPDRIRLRSSTGRYLTASDERFLLGAAGHKVVLAPSPASSAEWCPVRDGPHLLKLRSSTGTFLRGNGGMKPYRGNVTHDIPHRTVTQDSILWDLDVIELRGPAMPSGSGAIAVAGSKQDDSGRGGDEVVVEEEEEDVGSESESSGSESPSIGGPPVRHRPGDSAVAGVVPKAEGRTIHYYIADSHGEMDGSYEEGTFFFNGSSVLELTKRVEELTGLEGIILCIRDVINDDKLRRLHLELPPNRRAMTVIVVLSSSPAAMKLDK